MVGFVIVSHSKNLAESVVELTSMMAPNASIRAAGGMEDGGFGTSFEKIQNAIDEIYTDEGVLILMDMGSAVMTTEMVLEMMPERKIKMVDCPLVEGAVAGTVSAVCGMSMEEIAEQLADVSSEHKF
jgi:phosphoenolpyruvate---glycerone phosphotransferase subunit DhaM